MVRALHAGLLQRHSPSASTQTPSVRPSLAQWEHAADEDPKENVDACLGPIVAFVKAGGVGVCGLADGGGGDTGCAFGGVQASHNNSSDMIALFSVGSLWPPGISLWYNWCSLPGN